MKEVAKILEKVYQDPYAYYEVNSTIYSGYYTDERVLLKDLLFPESSDLYKTQKFLSFNAEKGRFAKAFFETMNMGDFPVLQSVLKNSSQINNGRMEFAMATSPTDTSMQIFSKSDGISVYFPYSENFVVPLTTNYFDNINKYPFSTYFATIVSADRDADSAPGRAPRKINGGRDVAFVNVTVDDAYAEQGATHIVGVGAEPARVSQPQDPPVNLVFIGDVKCIKQYDRLISFSGNGGGSELRFIRGDGYLEQNVNGQITSPKNTVSVDIKRRDIRKGNWKTVNSIWDSNWEISNLNQVFGIYEEDNQGSSTFSGSLSTTLTATNTGGGTTTGGTTVGTIGYSVSVNTNDGIIRQLNWNRQSFFLYNNGTLNNGCGTRNAWTAYDCNTNVMYTMPQQ